MTLRCTILVNPDALPCGLPAARAWIILGDLVAFIRCAQHADRIHFNDAEKFREVSLEEAAVFITMSE